MYRQPYLAIALLLGGCSALFDFDGFSADPDDAGLVDSGADATVDAGCSCPCGADTCDGDGSCVPGIAASRVATGSGHACAVTGTGDVYCWGRNANGQLGTGTTEASDVPRAVMLSGTARAVGAGGSHSCAVLDSGAACWGLNDLGQLGDDSGTQRTSPAMVAVRSSMSPFGDQIALGSQHTCALTVDDPNTWCWGRGREGQLGDDSMVSKDIPVRVPSHVFDVLTAGHQHACGIDDRRALWCWGSDSDGQLGNGAMMASALLASEVVGSRDYQDVSAGLEHTCAVAATGELLCWGRGSVGQLGAPPDTMRIQSPRLVGADMDWEHVAAGSSHTCATKTDGRAFCFGGNGRGALGLGDTRSVDAPTETVGGIRWQQLAGGDEFTCGVDRSGRLFCWGQNDIGQLGLRDRMDRSQPTRVCLGEP